MKPHAQLERVDEMQTPPVVGRFYLVPCVHFSFHGHTRHWPVIGPQHTDEEHLQFEAIALESFLEETRVLPASITSKRAADALLDQLRSEGS